MTKYSILHTTQARSELLSVVDYIEKELYAPIAAERFYYGIKSTIEKLKENADIYKISDNFAIISKYGLNARRINYKEFAIIYTIEEETVIIHRIVHGSLIA